MFELSIKWEDLLWIVARRNNIPTIAVLYIMNGDCFTIVNYLLVIQLTASGTMVLKHEAYIHKL